MQFAIAVLTTPAAYLRDTSQADAKLACDLYDTFTFMYRNGRALTLQEVAAVNSGFDSFCKLVNHYYSPADLRDTLIQARIHERVPNVLNIATAMHRLSRQGYVLEYGNLLAIAHGD